MLVSLLLLEENASRNWRSSCMLRKVYHTQSSLEGSKPSSLGWVLARQQRRLGEVTKQIKYSCEWSPGGPGAVVKIAPKRDPGKGSWWLYFECGSRFAVRTVKRGYRASVRSASPNSFLRLGAAQPTLNPEKAAFPATPRALPTKPFFFRSAMDGPLASCCERRTPSIQRLDKRRTNPKP